MPIISEQRVLSSTVTLAEQQPTWIRWNTQYLTTNVTSSTSTAVWVTWNHNYPDTSWDRVPGTLTLVHTLTGPAPNPLTPAERAAIDRQIEIEAAARRQRRLEREAAEMRAEKLLQSALTPVQRECLAARGFFFVTGADGHLYKIQRGRARNIHRMDPQRPDQAVEMLCAHPAAMVPDADTMLAQKLMLEADPGGFRRIANLTPLSPAAQAYANLLAA